VVPTRKAGLHHTGRSNGHDRGQYLLHHRGETVAARRFVRIRKLKRGGRIDQVIRARDCEPTQRQRQHHRHGCRLRSPQNPLHIHVASKYTDGTKRFPVCNGKSVYVGLETWYLAVCGALDKVHHLRRRPLVRGGPPPLQYKAMPLRHHLEQYFEFQKLGATWKIEILAGFTTFMTMAYIVLHHWNAV